MYLDGDEVEGLLDVGYTFTVWNADNIIYILGRPNAEILASKNGRIMRGNYLIWEEEGLEALSEKNDVMCCMYINPESPLHKHRCSPCSPNCGLSMEA